jgi:hypothetical protein
MRMFFCCISNHVWYQNSKSVVSYEFVLQDLRFGVNKQGETWERVTQIRDKFEYDRERRMRERGKLIFYGTEFFWLYI